MWTKAFLCRAILFVLLLAVVPLRAAEVRWTYIEGAGAYRVEIRSEAGANVYRNDVTSLSVNVDLKPGNYQVRVSPINKFGRIDTPGDWTRLTVQSRKKPEDPKPQKPEIQRLVPSEIDMEAGNSFVVQGKNFPEGMNARLENAAGMRIPLTVKSQTSDRITASLPEGVFQQGEYTVVLTDNAGAQYRRSGLTLTQSLPPKPPRYISDDSFYIGIADHLLFPSSADYTFESSPWFSYDLFLGMFWSRGFSAELSFSVAEPLLGYAQSGYAGQGAYGAGLRETRVLTGVDISLAWSPGFNFPINPVVAASFGLAHTTVSSWDQAIPGSAPASATATDPKLGASLFLRFDMTHDFFVDLGYRIDMVSQHWTDPIFMHGALARMAMTFGAGQAAEAEQSGAGFGNIGIGLSASYPTLSSRVMDHNHGGFDHLEVVYGVGGIFFTFWLRAGLQLELHYERGDIYIDTEPFFNDNWGYYKSQSFAFDVVWSPEYAFFLKPLLSMGLGVYSSKFEIMGPGHDDVAITPVSYNLGVRWAAMLRIEIWRFMLDVGLRRQMIDALGSELWLLDPIVRLSFRF
ncbi:MAG: fibronectin type III domain-containing protein [Spirochaetota bacterium]|jgi:hypothetical protein|nr:fibronectin type III domain-containing protein [Spirochaetota bacterium]